MLLLLSCYYYHAVIIIIIIIMLLLLSCCYYYHVIIIMLLLLSCYYYHAVIIIIMLLLSCCYYYHIIIISLLFVLLLSLLLTVIKEIDTIFEVNNHPGDPAMYHWEFGNGDTRTTRSGRVVYAYANVGYYNCTVKVYNELSWFFTWVCFDFIDVSALMIISI